MDFQLTMEDDVLIFVVKKILKRGLSLISGKIGWNLRCELKQIHNSLTEILAFLQKLEDCTSSAGRFEVESFYGWLKELEEVSYEADDVFDDLAYEFLNPKVLYSFQFYRNAFGVRLVNKVNQSLLVIKDKADKMGIQSRLYRIRTIPGIDLDRVTDIVLEDTIVGRETEVSKIVNLVTLSCSQQILTVVPIVGMDGVGKTIVAKLVSEELKTRNLFDVHIWVSCSKPFYVEAILLKMLLSLNRTTECLKDLHAMCQELEKLLARKKTLLVLDAVSRTYPDDLKFQLLKVFTSNGNVVLVTTSMGEVASTVESSYQHRHNLEILSDEECWFIMKERAFRNMTTTFASDLEVIGKDIARDCGGLPLVAKVLGGTMGFDTKEEAWLKIRDRNSFLDDVKSILLQSFEQLPSSLKSCVALCLAFRKGISIRKEEFIYVSMAEGIIDSFDIGNKHFHALLENSFFQDVESSVDGDVVRCKMHDLVHDLAFSLFNYEPNFTNAYRVCHLNVDCHYLIDPDQCMKINSMANVIKLRTLILDHAPFSELWNLGSLRTLTFNGTEMENLPNSIAKLTHLRYLGVSNTKITSLPESITKLYHLQILNLSNSNIKMLPQSIYKLHNLQILNLSNSKVKELVKSITKLHQLQILNVSNTTINSLPKSIGKLQNLQTLNVSNSNIKDLPESITLLQNLQTLNVSNCNIKEFPVSITKLCNLQTLKFLGCKELSKFPRKENVDLINLKNISFSYEHHMPFGLGHLTCLQILPFFVVGSDMGGSIEELQFLNELRGHLEITRLEEVQDKEEAKRANLRSKTRLQGLSFQWSYGGNDRISSDEELLEGLRPNPNIKRIKIKHYMGEKWPSWMLQGINSFVVLYNLVDLTLEQCWNNAKIPCLGVLPYLKFLNLKNMGSVKCIDNGFYEINIANSSIRSLFPSLKSLSVSWMESLTEWSFPSDDKKITAFPCLENLSIQFCPKLATFPLSVLSALVRIEIKDCDELGFIFHKKQMFPHLTGLSIVGCPKLIELRDWLLSKPCFREFNIRRCQWLIFVPKDLGNRSCLTSLRIYCCRRLQYFSEEILCGLTQLKHLRIGAFSEELDDFRYLNRIKDLPWLEDLEIWGSDFLGRQMSILPNQLQHLTDLKSLKIMGFATTEALPNWFTNLQSLSSLSLNYCRNLGSQSTAIMIPQLSNLTCLHINCCPVLEKSDSDWLKSLHWKKIKVEF